MMRRLRPLFLCSLLFLAACMGPAATSTSYKAPYTPGGRLCSAQCREAQSYCERDCDVHTRQCVSKAQGQALVDYDRYTRDQYKSKEPLDLRPRDFERMGVCDSYKNSCTGDCEKRYQSCYEKCGGTVNVISSCQFLCF